MKAFPILLLFILTLIAYSDQDTKETIAIIDFDDLTNSNLGPQVAEFLRTSLAQTKKFTVVERAQLEKVLKEQKFTMSELVDPANAAKLGKLIGANYITIGSITKFGSCWLINARFIDVNTAQTIKAAQAKGSSQDEFIDMMNSLIKQLTGAEIIESRLKRDIIFEDNFDGKLSKTWKLCNTNTIIFAKDGFVTIGTDKVLNEGISGLYLDSSIIKPEYDYIMEFEISLIKPGQYTCAYIDFLNHIIRIKLPNVFNTRFNIFQNERLITKVDYNRGFFNKIKFEKIGNLYNIYINDNKCCSFDGLISSGNLIDFIATGTNIFSLRNFKITLL